MICVNLDTLALGSQWRLPPEEDPTYRLVDQRLVTEFEKRDIKVTLFAVGKDLEVAGNREFIKKWSRAGHEIGNHSYSHPLNLASLARRDMEIEIEKTDKLIKQITGKKQVRFNAPGWAMSGGIDRILAKLGYKFDYSPFMSWWIYPLLLKQWWSLRGQEIAKTVWRRRDLLYPVRLSRWDKLLLKKISLPTATWLKIPVWHTGWFIFGEKLFTLILKKTVKENSQFYYLMHPADVIDKDDIPSSVSGKINFERVEVPLRLKKKYLDRAFKILYEDS